MPGDLCEEMAARSEPLWSSLRSHPFLREIAEASLPIDSFRFYLEQDILYLAEFARCLALATAKASDHQQLRTSVQQLRHVVEEELPKNEELLKRAVDAGAKDRGGGDEMAPACLAYTAFMEATAYRGAALEVHVALLPCVWSYYEIASALSYRVVEHPIYTDWLAFFAQADYAAQVASMKNEINDRSGELSEAARSRLADVFLTSLRFEERFWSMAHACETWSDHVPLREREVPAP
jgi:thiaminase (transcriptional activator TenA)